jgi:hypothetical protein
LIRWVVALVLIAGPASAAERAATPARFAVVIGANQSVDPGVAPLRYADDDAANYQDLFRTLGARTYLLSRFDENTRRLHPQAVAEAQDPRRPELLRVLDQVVADVARARARQVRTVLYFVFAGHGDVQNGRGYLALEDSRLYGSDLEQLVLDRVHADEAHMIVDACYSVFLAFSRGPGGERRESHGFAALGGLGARADVGLLLSTSSARESHEWSEFQAGIFSHEVRSGFLGAADADGDGQISYREIAAFVERANAAVPNEKFRPDVYAKPPANTTALLDLRPALAHRLELEGEPAGHYLLERADGVRLADFHGSPGQRLRLIRLASAGRLFLRRVGAVDEYVMDAGPDVLRFDQLPAQQMQAQARGAAHESFSLLFTLPFSQHDVDGFVWRAPSDDRPRALGNLSRPAAIALVTGGAALLAGATGFQVSALGIQHTPATSQRQAFEDNDQIRSRNTWARWLGGIGGAALVTGAVLWAWPRPGEARSALGLSLRPDGVAMMGSF